MSPRAWIVERYYAHRFALQFITLAFVLVADPVLELFGVSGSVLDRGMAICIALALVGFERRKPPLVRLVIALMVAAAIFTAILGHEIFVYGDLVWIAFGVPVIAATVREALRPGDVHSERIFAALDAYLLAGLLFGACYWQLAQHSPGSFGAASELHTRIDAVFFSYGTLATLGYGNVVPTSSAAHGLTVIEAMGGQIYLAVLLARLVSLYTPRSRAK